MAAVQQQTTQLEFHQAMADFKVMFPEMDHDVIEAVLRANQGAVDATIDQLLAMSTDNENERLRNEMEKKEKQQWTSQASSTAVPTSATSAMPSIKATPSQPLHPCQLRPTSTASPLLSLPQNQQTSTAQQGGPPPIPSALVSSGHSPNRHAQSSAASASSVPTGSTVSPSKAKEPPNLQLIPSPATSTASSPRKTEERDGHCRTGPNGDSSSDKEDGAEMVEQSGAVGETDAEEKIPLRVIHGWEPPLVGQLPDDFLRIAIPSPSVQWTPAGKKSQGLMLSHQLLQQRYAENQERRGALLGAGGAVGDPDLDRFLEDERIALFLQNEEFMAELRWNKDFLSTLEKGHDEDALFKERLRNMGKVSRKKFAQLARVFTGRKKRSGSGAGGAKHILSQGPAPSRDNLLLNAEPLLPDEDDDEEDMERFDGEAGGGSEAEEVETDQGDSGRCRRAQRHMRLGGGDRRKRSGQRASGDGKEEEDEEDKGGGDFHHHHLRESHNGGHGRRAESRD
ncbi:CUE domain-containing protein 1 isoform X2 [Hetaerina americana]|uniref:CUE domain-containing protein 1 isoform X2 n=1 Tax=Hetaerina americana TaxID=62018 RepID=UPI003A7F344C